MPVEEPVHVIDENDLINSILENVVTLIGDKGLLFMYLSRIILTNCCLASKRS